MGGVSIYCREAAERRSNNTSQTAMEEGMDGTRVRGNTVILTCFTVAILAGLFTSLAFQKQLRPFPFQATDGSTELTVTCTSDGGWSPYNAVGPFIVSFASCGSPFSLSTASLISYFVKVA